jgi:hypothetical protein
MVSRLKYESTALWAKQHAPLAYTGDCDRNGAARMDHSHVQITTLSGAILCNVTNFVIFIKIICTQKY